MQRHLLVKFSKVLTTITWAMLGFQNKIQGPNAVVKDFEWPIHSNQCQDVVLIPGGELELV